MSNTRCFRPIWIPSLLPASWVLATGSTAMNRWRGCWPWSVPSGFVADASSGRIRCLPSAACSSSKSGPWIPCFNINYHCWASMAYRCSSSSSTPSSRWSWFWPDGRLSAGQVAQYNAAFLIMSGSDELLRLLDGILFYVPKPLIPDPSSASGGPNRFTPPSSSSSTPCWARCFLVARVSLRPVQRRFQHSSTGTNCP